MRTQTWFAGDQGFVPSLVPIESTPPISPSSSPVEQTPPDPISGNTQQALSPRQSAIVVPPASRSPRLKSSTQHNQDALDLADALAPSSSPRSAAARHLDRVASRVGAVFSTMHEPLSTAPPLPPWAEAPYSERESFSQRLSHEILDFALYVTQLFDDSRHLYESTLAKVVAVTQRVLPHAKVQPFGSYACGLCIPTSDLDIVCSIKDEMENLRKAFRTLARELRKEEWVVQITPIETATMPIIKLLSRDEGIPTDITFDCAMQENGVPQHRGLRSVELTRRYASETPKLRPLLLVLKQFLHERGLNNPYTGGLGSYCLVLMLKTFLSLFDASGNVLDEGGALVAFFRYYGTVFDYSTTGISVRHGGVHFRIGEVGHYGGTGPLVIEDPFDPMTNIASGVFAMWRVRAAFESAFAALTTSPSPPVVTVASAAATATLPSTTLNVSAATSAPTLLSRIILFDQ